MVTGSVRVFRPPGSFPVRAIGSGGVPPNRVVSDRFFPICGAANFGRPFLFEKFKPVAVPRDGFYN